MIPDDIDDSGIRKILESLDPSERRFWKERKVKYENEFNFNESSDRSLLFQLITEELIQQRLMIKKLTDPEAATDSEMTNSMARLQKCMESLGITRKQRQAAKEDTIEGSISKLAGELDKKIKTISAKEKKDEEEEIAYTKLKSMRGGPRNVVPSLEEIKKIQKQMGIKDVI